MGRSDNLLLPFYKNTIIEKGDTALLGFTNDLSGDSFLHTGINGLVGLEYTFEEVPINCSIDTGPFIFLSPYVNFAWGGGLAIRYAIR